MTIHLRFQYRIGNTTPLSKSQPLCSSSAEKENVK
jgi:hypothetical protein